MFGTGCFSLFSLDFASVTIASSTVVAGNSWFSVVREDPSPKLGLTKGKVARLTMVDGDCPTGNGYALPSTCSPCTHLLATGCAAASAQAPCVPQSTPAATLVVLGRILKISSCC